MSVYNLPAIDLDGPMPPPEGYGRWQEAGDLAGLAKSLKLASSKAKISDVKSIPDAWAQPQLFQQALTEPSHELHADAVGQWRGLLALFALQPWFDTVYALELAACRLSDTEGPGAKLRKTLKSLEPQGRLVADASWDVAGLISFRPKGGGFGRNPPAPIGLLSPAVLVAPGKTSSAIREEGVPWLLSGLSDPLESGGLNSEHWSALVNYIRGLIDALDSSGAQSHNPRLHGELVRRLQEFGRACEARVVEPATLEAKPLDIPFPNPLYAALGRSWKLAESAVATADSRCVLQVRPDAAKLFDKVILIDPSMAETFGRDAAEIRVWEKYTLRQAQSPQTLQEIKRAAAERGCLVIEPSDLFTDILVTFKAGTEIAAHPPAFRAALMPLTPLAVLLFDPAEIAQAADVSDQGGRRRVRLNLRLAHDERRDQTAHTISRDYPDEAVQAEDRPDDLAFWPNFRDPTWRWTFMRFQYDPRYDLQTRFALSAEFLAADIEDRALGRSDHAGHALEWASDSLSADRRLYASPYSQVKSGGRVLLERVRFANAPELIGEHQLLPGGAEAVFFARRQGEAKAPVPAGLALVKFAETNDTHHPKDAVSIDFGTTNTVAYVRRAGAMRAVEFQDRLLFPIAFAQKAEDQRRVLTYAYTDFFPLRAHCTPFPTVAKRREFHGDPPSELQKFLREGHDAQGVSDAIFFMPPFDRNFGVPQVLNLIREGRLVFNIKWANDQFTRKLTARFLRQTMLMAAGELAAEGVSPADIKWRFSYPEAFKRRQIRDLSAAIREAWNDLFSDLKPELSDKDLTLETESESAARYFIHDEEQTTPTGDLMVMLDIGGGTTDIALWYEEKMRWRSSFKLAGGDFFTRYLANNFELLRKIDFDEVASFVEGGTGGVESSSNFVELFVNAPSFSENFQRKYNSFSAEPVGAGLRQCAAVALGGMLHYMGLVIKALIAQGAITRPEAALKNVTLAFAGRGSALFRQFNQGPPDDNDLTSLAKLLVAASGHDPAASQVDVLFSKEPKHEVARGLLLPKLGGSGAADAKERWLVTPAGEAITYSGAAPGSLEAGQDVMALDVATGVERVEPEELRAFLAALRKHTGLAVNLDGAKGEAARFVSQKATNELRRNLEVLKAEADDDRDTQAIEPPFVTELRALVELMSLPVKERDAKLSVMERDL